MQYVSKWEPTPYVIYQDKHCGRTVRREITEGSVVLSARGFPLGRRESTTGPQIDGQAAWGEMPWLKCDGCGMMIPGKRVLGKCSGKVKVCAPACMGASGANCDCPCVGANHGSRH